MKTPLITIAIFEIYGVKYDAVFHQPKDEVIQDLTDQCDSLYIHYAESIPLSSLTTTYNGKEIPEIRIIQ